MDIKVRNISRLLNLALLDKEAALEFVVNELSFANKSSLPIRNFAKSSGLFLKETPPLLGLDSPNFLLSKLLDPLGNYQSTLEWRLQIIDEIMEIYRIGKYSNVDDRNKIRTFCTERKITNLIHFTKIQNLRGILDVGLNSKEYNNEISKKHKSNDAHRFDYRTSMISLSISYPNDKMFYKYRTIDPGQQWAVLTISADVLWELNCLFCATNAANSSISSATDEYLSGSQALKTMFSQNSSKDRLSYPYDPQAEVLVNSHIPKNYIKSIFVEKKSETLSDLGVEVLVDSFYFQNREFALNKNHF